MSKFRHDPWYHGTADGIDPQDGETVDPEVEPASPEMREMAKSIKAEMQADPAFV